MTTGFHPFEVMGQGEYKNMYEIEFSTIDENWEGFDVGSSLDFAQEVRATEHNQALFEFLAQRRSAKERTRLSDVKRELGM